MSQPPFSHPASLLPGVPHIESPFFRQIFSDPAFDDETRRVARDLHEDGYAVVDFPESELAQMAQAIQDDLRARYDFDGWKARGHAAGISLRIQDAWTFNDAVRRIACNEKILALLSRLYGRRAWPFQTLNFPVGTQQHFHTDSIHFSSVPERFMCGVWLALEDIDADNGPLMYFPGSHKWPIYTNEHVGTCVAEMNAQPTQALYEATWRALVEAAGIEPRYFHAKKGQALIWAANLIHGGMRHNDKERTRWSQVTHYFFDDCAYVTPMMSDPAYGYTAFRELVDISSGNVMLNRYAGNVVSPQFIAAVAPDVRRWQHSFDPALYLEANPDVAASGMDPTQHYVLHGLRENRRLRP